MNRWMNSPQYLAQIGHFLGACLLIVLVTLLSVLFAWAPTVVYGVLGVSIVAALLKEFWYDLRYELPTQTFGDSLMDFGFYMLGAGVGLLINLLALHYAKHC